MGIAIVLALLVAVAAGGSSDKKKASAPAPKPSDDEMSGGGKTTPGKGEIFTPDEPSDEVKILDAGIRNIGGEIRKFTDLGSAIGPVKMVEVNPAKTTGDWSGLKTLPQPHRNLALNVTKDVIYRSLNAPGPLCWAGTCSSATVLGALKAIDGAVDLMKYPEARKELWGAYYRLRDAGR